MQTDSVPATAAPAAAVRLGRLRRSACCGLALYLVATIAGLLLIAFAATGAAGLGNALTWALTWKNVTFVVLSAVGFTFFMRHWLSAALHERAAAAARGADYRQIFDASASPMLVYDPQSLALLDANPAASAFWSLPREQLRGLTLERLWATGIDGTLGQTLAGLRAQPQQIAVTCDHLSLGDGRTRLAEVRDQPLDYHGHRARLVTVTDRSAQAQAQADQDQARARLEEVHRIARIGSWELDPQTGMGLFSDQVYTLLGRKPPAQPHWHRLEELLVVPEPDNHANIQSMLSELCRGRSQQLDVLLPVMSMDRRALTLHLRATSRRDLDGRPLHVHGTLQDVTEHEHSRRLLREREEQFRELVRVLPDGVVILSGDHVLYVNATGASQFGATTARLIGESLDTLVDDADLARVREHLRLPQDRREAIAPLAPRMRRRDGSRFRAGLSVGDVRYGGRDCTLLIVRDLTEPERNREALQTSNHELQAMAARLFSLQEDERRAISRDLHDDIGQAITAMKLSAHAALEEGDAGRRQDDLRQITALADSTIAKLRNLSMLLRPPQLDALGLEAALRWQAGMLFRSSSVELLADIAPLPRRPSGKIEQACFRIAQESLTNALRHAMASQVQLRLDDDQGRHLRLQITDDGEGFDPSAPRGLGLIVMRERAQAVGGRLHIRSAPGSGTHVELHLPYQPDTTGNHDPAGY